MSLALNMIILQEAQQIELLQMDDLGDPMWQRAKNHLRYAEQIIQELGDTCPSKTVKTKKRPGDL